MPKIPNEKTVETVPIERMGVFSKIALTVKTPPGSENCISPPPPILTGHSLSLA